MKKVLNKYMGLEEMEVVRQWFLENCVRKEIPKGSFFFREGDIKHYVGYIETGSFRYLKLNINKNQEQIVGYSFENDFVTDYGSLQQQESAVTSAQAIKDSVIWMTSAEKLNQFYQNCGVENLRAIASEVLYADMYDRLLSLYVDSPKERYFKLIEKFPNILNLVTLKEIASFIKVTPETLSRIRRNVKQHTNKHENI
ncbi:Crp/Fnr family transcriptional regulator [Dysgonomonas sp. Marseille-P4361]|uniref:Crp/Fnr family transcriptional regulator n=1 Tax=Dysgonomonas sp. Marseille-P4361 TaxID=2161820 RepID=UPI000D555105|nr:Crp/Fnr family transcriptional regulator [Dysgonomonas sp. Marseille-P4361]